MKTEVPIKVLYVNGGLMDYGGISSYMMNYFRHLDGTIIHIDFIVHGFDKGLYDNEIIKSGSKIYHVPIKSKDYFGNVKALKSIFLSGEYRIVHAHLDAGSYHVLKIAKECGIPIRIAHSHNTQFLTSNHIQEIINRYYKKNIVKVATHLFACSKAAGRWLYGDKADFSIINNAIDIDSFELSLYNRANIRKQIGFNDQNIVIGHVGRFDFQKNHIFLINLFSKLKAINDNYRLLLIGDGLLKTKIVNAINELDLDKNVIMVGNTDQVSKYYSAFDVFVLPSLFEGLPVSAIEAQANGLPCLFSDRITDEVILNNADSLPLDEDLWVDYIKNNNLQRKKNTEIIREKMKDYDIIRQANFLQEFYLNLD